MKKIHNSNKGFSIVLAMGVTIVLSLIAILILEFIIPFSNNVKSVENGSSAYYYAYSGIENSLRELAKQANNGYGTGNVFSAAATGSQYSVASMTNRIPPYGQGNSEYDENWNRFDTNTPIQLALTDNSGGKISVDFINDVHFYFRVPDISGAGAKTMSGSENIINWIMSGINNTSGDPVTLNASGSYITATDINNMTTTPGTDWILGTKIGGTVEGDECTVDQFYKDNGPCNNKGIDENPVLKMSIINKLEDTDGGVIPYLEYVISFSGTQVPGRYSQINTAGKSYGYKKTMDIKVPQTSTNQAFDFAVFQ